MGRAVSEFGKYHCIHQIHPNYKQDQGDKRENILRSKITCHTTARHPGFSLCACSWAIADHPDCFTLGSSR